MDLTSFNKYFSQEGLEESEDDLTKGLRNNSLSRGSHEDFDKHLIGETLGTPIIVSNIHGDTPDGYNGVLGTSPLPSRQDHTHAFNRWSMSVFWKAIESESSVILLNTLSDMNSPFQIRTKGTGGISFWPNNIQTVSVSHNIGIEVFGQVRLNGFTKIERSSSSGRLLFYAPTLSELAGSIEAEYTQFPGVGYRTTAYAANVHTTTTGSLFRSTSSIKYKKDVEALDKKRALRLIEQSRPVWYRSTSKDDKAEWSWDGFIAEEINEIDPRYCSFNEEGEPESVDYARYVVSLVSVVQDLLKRVESLEEQLRDQNE